MLSRLRLNTDQGSEYTAAAFRAACARLDVCQSMGRPGSALDNAVIESWHSTVEFELRRIGVPLKPWRLPHSQFV